MRPESLRFLGINGNTLAEEGSIALGALLKKAYQLTDLHLARTTANLDHILPSLVNLRKIARVNIGNNFIENSEKIANIIEQIGINNESLEFIGLSGTKLTSQSIPIIFLVLFI